MTSVDLFTHMEEAWKLDRNPFPAEGIRGSSDQPHSKAVFPEETQEFYRKFIRAGALGDMRVGFLWSRGPGGDTGYGKTTMMQVTALDINPDLGKTVLTEAGVRPDRLTPIAAAYSNLNNLNATGLYSVLHNAVIYAAEPGEGAQSVFDKARACIVDQLGGDDARAIASHILSTRLSVAPASSPLRPELVAAFANDSGRAMLKTLSEVTEASRARNGRQYLDFLLTVLTAAEINHLFIFVDQLEDLVTNRSITSAKRSREVGRIRDFLEVQPYAGRLHFVLTLHSAAARDLAPYWQFNRLPRYEIAPDNTSSVVVLSGLHHDEQVEELLRVYLEEARTEQVDDPLLPFESGVAAVLRQVSQGRVGVLLTQAREIFNAAAERGLPRISADFARRYFEGRVEDAPAAVEVEDTGGSEDVDDILLR